MYDFLDKDKWALPLRVCELYGGIGSQLKALNNIGVDIKEHYLVEVDIDATISYAAIHCNLDKHLPNQVPNKEQMIQYLTSFNFRSQNKLSNLSRLNIDKLKKLYVAQKLTKNLGDVSKLHDLPAVDLITWSTPCQDFSVAGKGKGFDGDRGGLTFLTLKLFRNLSYKPTFLLFENVPAITNKHFIGGFNLMLNELESLGYTNHVMRLNAKHYGVPQNRDRVYVLSVRNDYPLEFQTPKTKSMPPLKDYIEKQNDEFNLSENQKKILEKTKINIDINKGVFVATAPNSREYKGFKDVSPTLCARDYKDPKWVSLPNDSLTIIDDTQGFDGVRIYGNYSPTLRSQRQGLKVQDRLHIRKLTPLEYFRLMGFSDTDYDKAKVHASNSTLYKQAGNSIVVQVLESIFNNIFIGENNESN
jgi:DNA (cytosine-5)-methyltransferase 1